MAVFADPAAGEQITDHALVQAARRLHVEVLEAGGLTQARLSQTGEQGRVGAIGRLAVDQQGELVGKIQLAAIGEALQVFERTRHAEQFQALELFEVLVMHRVSPSDWLAD